MSAGICLGVGMMVGLGTAAIIDRVVHPIHHKEIFVCSITAIAISLIGAFWGDFSAWTAFAGGFLATLITLNDANNLTTKIAVRLAFVVIFGGIGLGFQRTFI